MATVKAVAFSLGLAFGSRSGKGDEARQLKGRASRILCELLPRPGRFGSFHVRGYVGATAAIGVGDIDVRHATHATRVCDPGPIRRPGILVHAVGRGESDLATTIRVDHVKLPGGK